MKLDDLRKKVDELDAQIVRLVNERARLALEIGRLKERDNEALYVPARQIEVYENIAALNEGPLPDSCLKAVYREIMGGVWRWKNRSRSPISALKGPSLTRRPDRISATRCSTYPWRPWTKCSTRWNEAGPTMASCP
jgi:chorismate mutase-like protein